MKLKGRVTLIAGAGSGVGRAIAELFVKEGALVLAVDPTPSRVDEVVSAAQGTGGSIVGLAADVFSNGKDIEGMIDAAMKTYGRLDILCNNAGIRDRFLPSAEVVDEVWEHAINANLYGPFRASRLAVPIMVRQGGGTIINIASIEGLERGRTGAVYAAAKHGLVGLTKNIAWTYQDRGIRCNAICLGEEETAMDASGEPILQGFGLLPRMGKPEDIAQAALFLASDESSHINGSAIMVDGAGWHYKKAS